MNDNLCCLLGLHDVNVSHGYKQKWPHLGKVVGNVSGVSGGKKNSEYIKSCTL